MRKLDAVGVRSFGVVIAYMLAAAVHPARARRTQQLWRAAIALPACKRWARASGCRPMASSNISSPTALTMRMPRAPGGWRRARSSSPRLPMTKSRCSPSRARSRVPAGGFDVIVEGKNGRSIAGIDVGVTCDGSTKSAGVTQAEGFAVDCKAAPTAITLGLTMFGVAPQTLESQRRVRTPTRPTSSPSIPAIWEGSVSPTCRCISTAMCSR